MKRPKRIATIPNTMTTRFISGSQNIRPANHSPSHALLWNLVLGTSLVLAVRSRPVGSAWDLEFNAMPDSIKKQIVDRILSDLAPLKPSVFRDITREHDSTRDSKALPALMIYDGPEKTVAKDTTQWTCRFSAYFKIVFTAPRNAQATKDALITEIQKKIEADLTLNSLGGIIDAGNEEPAPNADSNPIHRTTLIYTVEYKRKIGDPTLIS